VDPQQLIEQYGADTVRLFTMFAAPPEQSLEWSDSGVEGAYRFLKRLWTQAYERRSSIIACNQGNSVIEQDSLNEEQKNTRREIHEWLQQALNDFSRYQFNTVVSACMKILNSLARCPAGDASHADACINHETMSILIRLLSPVAPHISMSLWSELGYGDDILQADWPLVDENALVRDSIDLAIQVNGKVRATINVAANSDHKAIESLALANENVIRNIGDMEVKKVIIVPGKLVSIVAK
jgi:leucyl-tRNA synthetase